MSAPEVDVAMRIPGAWSHPSEMLKRMPKGCRFSLESLTLPDGTKVDWRFADADNQFPAIFRNSCRRPPTPEEVAEVDGYRVNVLMSGLGGSLDAARSMMRAAAAVIEAGGAGVFIDNCGLSHGGRDWLAMTEDGGPDAVSFAFVALVRGDAEIWTMGMHVMGLRELVMKRTDVEDRGYDIVQLVRYVCQGDAPVEDGHVIADPDGPLFRAMAQESSTDLAGSPMHNPFGRLKLVSMRDIAERN